ncbi:MAG: TIM barrel protein [Cyclobacteriaceae bacterium]
MTVDTSRRNFLKTTAIGSAAITLPAVAFGSGETRAQIGLQLWTLRKEIEKDLAGTLQKIAAIGFRGVETAFFPEDVTIQQAAKALRKAGLKVFSVHCELPIGKQKDNILEMAEAYQCKRMVWHGWPEDPRYKTTDGIKELADIYNQAYSFAQSNGLQFGLHNHWWEFEVQAGGTYPYQTLLELIDENIFFEIDTYWAKVAGQDPAVIVGLWGKRAPLLHIKDGPGIQDAPMVAAGKGVQDFPGIVAAAKGATEWMIVELDDCKTDMLQAVKDSYTYLTTKGLAKGKI